MFLHLYDKNMWNSGVWYIYQGAAIDPHDILWLSRISPFNMGVSGGIPKYRANQGLSDLNLFYCTYYLSRQLSLDFGLVKATAGGENAKW